jgi:hypothetical protein
MITTSDATSECVGAENAASDSIGDVAHNVRFRVVSFGF